MVSVLVQEAAAHRLDAIYRYSRDQWGVDQANRYLAGMFDAFSGIVTGHVTSKPIPAEFGVEGFVFRYERHYVYWRRLANGDVGIVTVLHERMHQGERFREDQAP